MIKSNLDKVYQADHHNTLYYVMPFLYQLRVTVVILSSTEVHGKKLLNLKV